jgi:DNA-binding transcriptional LysR family regulator
MTLEQLRIFVGVAEREHVTKAAEVLNVTQSAASGAIAALEARYGVPLFHRVGRGIQLTEAGRGFLEEARAVLGRAAHAETMLADYAGLARGSLRIVASQTIASYWLPAKLAAFHERHPQIAVELAIDNTEGAAAQVLSGAAELGFVEGEVDEPALAHWLSGVIRWCWSAARTPNASTRPGCALNAGSSVSWDRYALDLRGRAANARV